MRSPYRLVIFDFDGTLADSGDWMVGVLNEIAAKHRFRRVNDDDIDHLRGLDTRGVMKSLGVQHWRLPFIAADMRRRSVSVAEKILLFDGIEPLLGRLHGAGVRIAVVSSNSEATIRTVLGTSASLVSDYACGVSLFGKAGRFKAMLKRAGVSPADALCVGDEERDIHAAQKAGVTAAAVGWGYAKTSVLKAAGPTHLFDTVAALEAELLRGA